MQIGLRASSRTGLSPAGSRLQKVHAYRRLELHCTSPKVQPPGGNNRFTVTLKKPLGIVLEEAASGIILVADVAAESAAEKAGVKRGDQLLATSGVIYTKELDYAGERLKGCLE